MHVQAVLFFGNEIEFPALAGHASSAAVELVDVRPSVWPPPAGPRVQNTQ